MKVALVGCGAIAPQHVEALKRLVHQCQVITLCDNNLEQAEKLKSSLDNGCQVTTSFDEVILDPNIDVIHILTPHFLHAPMAIRALEAHKHVVLEKPVAMNHEEFEALKEAESKSRGTLNIILQNRYNPNSLYLKDVALKMPYGELVGVKGQVSWQRQGDYYLDSPWRGKWATEGGGLLINQCIHTLDLMQWIGGPVKEIQGVIGNLCHPYIEVEDTANLCLTYEGGQTGIFYGTNNHVTNSAVELELIYQHATLWQHEEALYLKENTDNAWKMVEQNKTLEGEKGYWGKGHQDCIRDIYDNLLTNQGPAISLEDARIAHELIFDIYDRSKKSFL